MQDLYPWKKDIASSSPQQEDEEMSYCWTVALTGLIAWHGTTLRWHEKICLSSFCTGGRVIGKSNGRSNRSGNSSWLGPGAIRTISTFSVLTLIRQALNRLVGGYAYAYRPFQFWTRLSTFQDVSSRMGETYIANFVFLPRENRSTNGLPQARKILSATVWFRLQSVLRIWLLLDRWSVNTFRCPRR